MEKPKIDVLSECIEMLWQKGLIDEPTKVKVNCELLGLLGLSDFTHCVPVKDALRGLIMCEDMEERIRLVGFLAGYYERRSDELSEALAHWDHGIMYIGNYTVWEAGALSGGKTFYCVNKGHCLQCFAGPEIVKKFWSSTDAINWIIQQPDFVPNTDVIIPDSKKEADTSDEQKTSSEDCDG